MRIFHRNRLSEERVQNILRALPQMKAPVDLEAKLGRIIEIQKNEVPHILGSLPMVPAPEDFDARLREAIHDRRRPVAPITAAPVADSVLHVNWLNSIMGWAGGAAMVVLLAFIIDRSGLIEHHSESPATVAPAVAIPVEASRPVPPAVSVDPVKSAPAVHEEPEAPSIVRQNAAEIPPEASSMVVHETVTSATPEPAPERIVRPQQRPVAPAVTEPEAAPEQNVSEHPTAHGAAEVSDEDSNAVSPEKGMPAEPVDNGVVDTGGERDHPKRSAP